MVIIFIFKNTSTKQFHNIQKVVTVLRNEKRASICWPFRVEASRYLQLLAAAAYSATIGARFTQKVEACVMIYNWKVARLTGLLTVRQTLVELLKYDLYWLQKCWIECATKWQSDERNKQISKYPKLAVGTLRPIATELADHAATTIRAGHNRFAKRPSAI